MTSLRERLSAFAAADPHLGEAVRIAGASGCRILLVGGAVRDVALGRGAFDLDFILDGPPRPFLPALARAVGHRVVTFRKRGIVDHRIRVGEREWDFVERGRRSLRREILRRDFGLNAVAFDPGSGALIDPGGGRRDLARRRIRALSSSVFRDDPLRMLRAVRLRAEIPGLSLARATARAIARDARLLRRSSPERIKAELDRILVSPRPSRSFRLLDRLGLLQVALPELDPLRGLAQNRYHHLDAFQHTLAALAAADDPRALGRGLSPLAFLADPLAEDRRARTLSPERARLLRWALVLHDTGKAETRTKGEDGEHHFYMHERASARIARSALRRLRASRAETQAVETLVALHLRISIPPDGAGAPEEARIRRAPEARVTRAPQTRALMTPRALRRIVREAGDLTPLLALHSLADKTASRGAGHAATLARLRRAGRALLETWRAEAERARREPPFLDGHDVMRALDAPPGPEIGALLAQLEDLQAAGELRTRDAALAWLASRRGQTPSGS